jgi:hypothetical protein
MRIHKNLQRHMLRVAAVGKYLCEGWSGEIDGSAVVDTLLLHDLGNLLKVDLNRGLEFFDDDEQNVDYWRQVKSEMQNRYSEEEHEATSLMAREAGVRERVMFLLEHMGSIQLAHTGTSTDWELKVCTYADFRVGPDGFLTVRERFEDILERYKGRRHTLSQRKQTMRKMHRCLMLEIQLQLRASVDLSTLPEDELEAEAVSLRTWELQE